MSFEIPNKEQARGIKSKEPPATPDAPQAAKEAIKPKISAMTSPTSIPKVCTAASVITVIVTAAPLILIVAPRGIEME